VEDEGRTTMVGTIPVAQRRGDVRARGRRERRRLIQTGLALAGLSLLTGCGLLPPPAPNSPKTPRVGFLAPTPDDNPLFIRGLADRGYVEGRDIDIEYRYAGETVDQFLPRAAELVDLPVDLIVTTGTPAATAAKRSTTAIPIVMVQVADPVGSGLIASLARPGGNITGTINFGPILSGKRLELLNEVIPGLARVAIIWSPDNPATRTHVDETRRATQALGIGLQSLEVRGADDLSGAFEAAGREHAQAAIIPRNGFSNANRTVLIELAARSHLPAIFVGRDFAVEGGLMAFGAQQAEMYTRLAAAVERILKGARPADLPVEQPTMFELVVNLKTAQALGLTMPQSVLTQATEVIQ